MVGPPLKEGDRVVGDLDDSDDSNGNESFWDTVRDTAQRVGSAAEEAGRSIADSRVGERLRDAYDPSAVQPPTADDGLSTGFDGGGLGVGGGFDDELGRVPGEQEEPTENERRDDAIDGGGYGDPEDLLF